jgi:large subunit ribosomal protein L9
MNVILLKDVEKLGLRGEVVNVARGYARNFLLPRNLAEVATEGRVKEVKRIDAQKAMHEARSTEQANEIAETLGKLVLRFDVKSGPTGSLFGSVTTTDIADEIWRIRKIRVDRRKIGVDNIKRIGRYTVPIELFEGISAEVKLMVVPEGASCRPRKSSPRWRPPRRPRRPPPLRQPRRQAGVDESDWELVEDGVVLDEASVVEVEENAAGEIDDVVVIEDRSRATRPRGAESEPETDAAA